MTGPLAQQIARVRERHLKLEGGHWYVIGHGELEDIERHLQDMTCLAWDVVDEWDEPAEDGTETEFHDRVERLRDFLHPKNAANRRAALPAREKGTE